MSQLAQRLLMASGGKKDSTYVDDVFSTYLYEGNETARTINNGVDTTKGAMVWVKNRDNASFPPYLYDTERGTNKQLRSSSDAAQTSGTNTLTAYNNNGISLGTDTMINRNGDSHVAWSFRKAPGFFDVVKYTGSNTEQNIAHNLGCVPGCIIVKRIDQGSGYDWAVLHRGFNEENPGTHVAWLNLSNAAGANSNYWDNTAPTSTHFCAKAGYAQVNQAGGEYIAYLFAGGESTAATARSVSFDGSGSSTSDYLTPASAMIPSGKDANQFCLEAWVKFDTDQNNQVIYSQYDSTSPGRMFFQKQGDHIELWQGGSSENLNTGTNSIHPGQWYHIAWTYDAATHRLFLDGILKDTLAGSSLSNNIDSANPRIGNITAGGYGLDGQLSNFRITHGQPVYLSTFKPSTEPLTTTSQGVTGTNCKILCCNNSTTTHNDGSGGTITANGSPVAKITSPFLDPDSLKFGENEDQSLIKTGRYIGNGSTDGPHINCGWEPQRMIFKIAGPDGDPWYIADTTRAIVTDGADNTILPGSNQGENVANWTLLDVSSTGWKPTTADSKINGNNKEYVYIAVRRPDGYVGKPPEDATDVFAMGVGSGNAVIPPGTFSTGFPVDFALMREPAASSQWYTTSRLQGYGYVRTNDTTVEAQGNPSFAKDSNEGWGKDSYGSNWQSWAWKRGQGFDVVCYTGDNNGNGRPIPHSLNNTPEMIWVKARNYGQGPFMAGHKGLNGGTDAWDYYVRVNTSDVNSNADWVWKDTAPTSTHFTVANDSWMNTTYNYVAYLFASSNDVNGNPISKCGYYAGNGSARTITTGFQPRFLIVKNITAANHWFVLDTTRGWGSGNDNHLSLNRTNAQGSFDFGAPTSTGFTLPGADGAYNASSNNYIYYAHA